jgi:hypothetical protein
VRESCASGSPASVALGTRPDAAPAAHVFLRAARCSAAALYASVVSVEWSPSPSRQTSSA